MFESKCFRDWPKPVTSQIQQQLVQVIEGQTNLLRVTALVLYDTLHNTS
jgi:hypothetical protein